METDLGRGPVDRGLLEGGRGRALALDEWIGAAAAANDSRWSRIITFWRSNELIICCMRDVKSFFRSRVSLAWIRFRSFLWTVVEGTRPRVNKGMGESQIKRRNQT